MNKTQELRTQKRKQALAFKELKKLGLTEPMSKQYRYMLLGRVISDCEYFSNWGNGSTSRLYMKDIEKQVTLMLSLYHSFVGKDKPLWTSLDKILAYRDEIRKGEKGE